MADAVCVGKLGTDQTGGRTDMESPSYGHVGKWDVPVGCEYNGLLEGYLEHGPAAG